MINEENVNLKDQYSFIAEIAPVYSKDRWAIRDKVKRELRPVIQNIPPKSKVLELGAGGGVIVSILEEAGFEVTGVDVVPEMVLEANKRGVQSVIHADGLALPFPENSFDVVMSWGNTLGPIPGEDNRHQMLKEARRVLKDDGLFFISVLNKGCSARRVIGPKEYTFHYSSRSDKWVSSKKGFNRFYGVGELKNVLKAAGFQRFRRLSPRCDASIVLIADGKKAGNQ